jgi:hypothetical protein
LLLVSFLFVAANSGIGGFLFQIVPLWSGSLLYLIGVPVLGFTLVALTCHNFKQTAVGWRTYGRNGLTWIITLLAVLLVTGLIYNRAWEKLTPFEPPHGHAQLTLSNPAILRSDWNTISVRLPDGRIWVQRCYMFGSPEFSLSSIKMVSPAGNFYDGSNWFNVIQRGTGESVGIKTDGTLWVSTNSLPQGHLPQSGQIMTPVPTGNWVQFGADTNWSNLWANGLPVLLAKTDGTLWRWGPETWNNKLHEWPGLRAFTPERWRTNGSLWAQSMDRDWEHQGNLEERLYLAHTASPQNGQWHGTAMVSMILPFDLGVRSDGTFRIWAEQQNKKIKGGKKREWVWTEADSQIGKDTNWLALANCNNKVITLKDDGTLWLWNFHYHWMGGINMDTLDKYLLATAPVRLGIHSDWISVVSAGNGVISLAADGSLWYWPLENPNHFGPYDVIDRYPYHDPHGSPLLKMSRKPQFLGNIFGGNN